MQNSARKFSVSLLAGLVLAAGYGPAVASEMKISATAATQIGKHDSKDRFCYDGSCVMHGSGNIDIDVDPETNAGTITATFNGDDGEWKIVVNKFQMIRTDVNLHGATGGDIDPKMSPPVLPQVWTYLATWGPGQTFHNGKLAWMGPTHLMFTEQVRSSKTGKVDYKGPMKAKEYGGSVSNKHAVQVHIVSHPAGDPVKGYLPPFPKFVHLMYDDVTWH
ncbi:MAG: pilin [Proteobacteria bacterium]|nr:pilin [Pseudomonadota bacterium]